MRKVSLLAAGLSVLALAACSKDTGNSVTNPDLNISFTKGTQAVTVSGPVWVLGEFDFAVTGGTPAGTNAHPQGLGSCDGSVWINPQGQPTGAPFCAGTTGVTTTVACLIDATGLPGTYAWGTTGTPPYSQTGTNENLNLHSDLIDQALDQFVHYSGKKNFTTGKDYTLFTYTCNDDLNSTGTAFFDLSQFNGSGNDFGGAYAHGLDRGLDPTDISVLLDDDVTTADAVWIAWTYRSRII